MRIAIPILCLALLAGPLRADDFPPISDEERALNTLPGQPGAPAVVLFEQAELKLLDYPREVSSHLKVNVRLKILTEEGRSHGEVEIPHSGFYRLRQIKGRTALPDGRTLPLPEDAIFEERRSRSAKVFVTKLVFPAVEVGAILDYRYTVSWDHLFFLEPWYFHNRVPTRRSEITFIKPENLALQPWAVQTQAAQPIQSETKRTPRGLEIRTWAENLPAIPDEPSSFPFADLSSRIMMVPTKIFVVGGNTPLLDSWAGTCRLFADAYRDARRNDRHAKKLAAELAAGETSLVDKIARIHAFVRDEIRTDLSVGVGVGEDEKVDKVLADRHGRPVTKALLLQSMLDGLKVDSDLVWVADRSTGRADLSVANPWWFDAALVRVEIDRQPLWLDPVDRSVGFGRLAPYYEGTQGVVFHKSKPKIVDLPAAPFEENLSRTAIDLAVDGEGRVAGRGSLEREGHQAWRLLRWKDGAEATAGAWRELLEAGFTGYDVSEVEVEEDVRRQYLRVGWSLSQRDEEVLGDEVTVTPAQPFVATQPFTLPPELRKTPVQRLYGERDELVTTLAWPEGWEIDAMPEELSHGGPAGEMECQVERGEDGRSVTIRRRFEIAEREFGHESYAALRELYRRAVDWDAQQVVLVGD
jgi:hypothetical protein